MFCHFMESNMNKYLTARTDSRTPESLLETAFPGIFTQPADSLFLDSRHDCASGISGLPFKAPVLKELRKHSAWCRLIDTAKRERASLLVVSGERGTLDVYKRSADGVSRVTIDDSLIQYIRSVMDSVPLWAGSINERGEHCIDLKTPSPGPHFFVNLLLGNRTEFDQPLQTTPKSVVDRLGRGSFRSHAATQVLATRWDLRQEENGFPCNRQFYLSENGAQLFYSAHPDTPDLLSGRCVHSQNRTVISYETRNHLRVERTIFLPAQEKGLPIATEIQRIAITNTAGNERTLRLTYTGMFGPSKPPALQEDVLYSNIIMEGGILFNQDGTVRSVSPRYFPLQDRNDIRFHTMIVRDKQTNRFPDEFCLNYNDFVGCGTLEQPDGLSPLTNELYRKGPGFFALGAEFTIKAGETIIIDGFTGLVSTRENPQIGPSSLEAAIDNLIARYGESDSVPRALEKVINFTDSFTSFMTLDTGNRDFSVYCSRNLPFQVLYQTFVSRSFGQTQKGYREIGFREIQDIFASLYYFNAQGNRDLVKKLIGEWASQVYEFGYANHNFFWEGKEAGKWSDDALWLHQAVSRYVHLTGDTTILSYTVPVAGTGGTKSRSIYDTLIAAIRYSVTISVGPHGIPLLDNTDWNDCLRLDRNYEAGPAKEETYKRTGVYRSNCTESVMNAFLAVIAIRETLSLAALLNDRATGSWLEGLQTGLTDRIRYHAWKKDTYARLLFNQYPGFEYAGADGDGLDTDNSGGTMFLNSFSWSILSGVANDHEIELMLKRVQRKLKTPFGLKLVSPNDLGRVVPGAASAEYFPGDRENGAVFKHASMMAVCAMFEAARRVGQKELAEELVHEAWNMIELVYPARTMSDPFVLAGNPRFCTQYNNSETGENIGPLLSGTASWLILALLKAYGIELSSGGLSIDPILPASARSTSIQLRLSEATVSIQYQKPEGFYRSLDSRYTLTLDGEKVPDSLIPLSRLHGSHSIQAVFS